MEETMKINELELDMYTYSVKLPWTSYKKDLDEEDWAFFKFRGVDFIKKKDSTIFEDCDIDKTISNIKEH